MIIRQEERKDREAVTSVVKRAFDSAEHSDGNEHDLVDRLRKSEASIPELSLVAEADGIIIGHIMFTRAAIGGKAVLALAPLSVLPGFQGRGTGLALIRKGHEIAEDLGYGYSVVLGSPGYYRKAGYVPARELGIVSPAGIPEENLMACKLKDDEPHIHGTIEYSEEFGIG